MTGGWFINSNIAYPLYRMNELLEVYRLGDVAVHVECVALENIMFFSADTLAHGQVVYSFTDVRFHKIG